MKKQKSARMKPDSPQAGAFKPMRWMKKRGTFTYQATDPVTGGLWSYVSKYARTQRELDAEVAAVLATGKTKRPKAGHESMLPSFGRMSLAESQDFLSIVREKTKSQP
jgi:hypothetical protein